MPIIPLQCPNCDASVSIDSNGEIYVCEYCNTPFIVKDAIVKNYINYVTNIYAGTVNLYNTKDFDIKAGKLLHYTGETDVVTIPKTVKTIGITAFYKLSIKEVVIPDTVCDIEDGSSYKSGAFGYCSAMKKVVIPGSVKRIGDYAFHMCKGLEVVEIMPGVEVIGKKAFYSCNSLKKVVIPDTVKRIESGAFESCKSLEKIEIPGPMEVIEDGAFGYCKNLKEVISSNDLFEQYGRAFKKTKWWAEKLEADRKSKGLCLYCGGEFKGIFIETCTRCGRKKNQDTIVNKISEFADQLVEEIERWEG